MGTKKFCLPLDEKEIGKLVDVYQDLAFLLWLCHWFSHAEESGTSHMAEWEGVP